jgi:lysozyme
MRHATEDGLRLIRRFEGFSATPYVCPAGYLTVGYGHLVKNPDAFRQPITEDEATEILAIDVGTAERAVLRLISVPLTDGQFDALVSFAFNLGAGALQRSTLRRKVNREEHDDVPVEFLRWVWAGGRKLNGLIRRRQAESALYQS